MDAVHAAGVADLQGKVMPAELGCVLSVAGEEVNCKEALHFEI